MKWLAYKYLSLRGWTFLGEFPVVPKLIAVGAPHTTNWDFVAFMAALYHFRLKVRFIGKHTLFRWPFGYFFRSLGGIAVDRSKPGGIVGQVADVFAEAEEMILVLAPEGTRKPAPFWKSGFLKIALAADVAVLLASVDYSRKQLTVGPLLRYDGDASAFMHEARSFYGDKEGLHPGHKGPITVREETTTS